VNAVVPLVIDTPIDWDAYHLTDDDRARVISPSSLVEKAEAILHGSESYEGVPLPFSKAENQVRLRHGKVSVWAGITHHGKTAMLKQVCLSLAKHGEVVCIASLEEVPEETFADLAQMALGMWVNERGKVQEVADWLHRKVWLYDQQGMVSADRMLALMTFAVKAKGCTHFVVDSLMRLGIQSDDYEAQRVFFNRVTSYAKQLNLHVHIVCHMRKQSDEAQIPNLMDVRGAAAIVEQADNVFVVWRDKRDQKPEQDPGAMLVVEKQRGRPNWVGRIKLWHDPQSGQFLGAYGESPQWFLATHPF
jgi:twinkle protein